MTVFLVVRTIAVTVFEIDAKVFHRFALEFLDHAYKIKPNDFDVLTQLGNVNFDLKRYPEAEKWYQLALKIKPDDVSVRTDLGLSYYFREPRELDQAIAVYRESLKYDPRHEKTLQNLTAALIDKGDHFIFGLDNVISSIGTWLAAKFPSKQLVPG